MFILTSQVIVVLIVIQETGKQTYAIYNDPFRNLTPLAHLKQIIKVKELRVLKLIITHDPMLNSADIVKILGMISQNTGRNADRYKANITNSHQNSIPLNSQQST